MLGSMTTDVEPQPQPPPGPDDQRRRGGRGNPLASPWLTASLALLVIGLIAANILVSNLGRLPGESPSTSPQASPSPAASPSASANPTFTRPTPTPLPTFITYVVAPRDSLNSIAARFGTKARSIAWWNRGRYPNLDPESPTYNPGLIEVGWTLVLIPGVTVDEEHPPTPSPGRATPTPPPSATPSASPTAPASPSLAAGGSLSPPM
jgi:hypothetical protein